MSGAGGPRRVRVSAPGKLNVFFAVGEAQEDGYHDVASVYQAVSLLEEVTATASDEFAMSVSGEGSAGVPLDESNLAMRAARMLADATGITAGVHLHIDKRVPVAGGMGGGSADAAAALVACDALWGTALTPDRLHDLGRRLGADVPFALMGGTAVGTGRGDQLSPALARGGFSWVLATSGEGLSTPAVYRELDRLRDTADIRPDGVVPEVDPAVMQALRTGDAEALARAARNDLQVAAFSLRPSLSNVVDEGIRLGALTGLVSGSGPTIAFLARDAGDAAQLAAGLRGAGIDAMTVTGPVAGTKVVGIE